VRLNWEHNYVVIEGGGGPKRPVKLLEMIWPGCGPWHAAPEDCYEVASSRTPWPFNCEQWNNLMYIYFLYEL
jgi:hypothetical protein